MATENEFVHRVCRIPLVSSAIGQIGSWYTHGKAHHTVFRLACETAEIGLRVAVVTTKPLLSSLEQPIDRLNQIACSQLNQLEATYPIINTPTEQVVSKVRNVFTGFLAVLTFDQTDNDHVAEDSEASTAVPLLLPAALKHLPSTFQATSSVVIGHPSVIFMAADRLLVATEKCLREQYNSAVKKYSCVAAFASQFALSSVAVSFCSRASKELDCYVSLISSSFCSQSSQVVRNPKSCLSSWSNAHDRLLELTLSIVDFIITHSPLMFLAPDFSQDHLVPDLDDEFVENVGNAVEGIVGYVPLNPADLAALPALRLRRICWRRPP